MLAACSGERSESRASRSAEVVISEEVVAAIARARGVTPERALELGTEDALLAGELRRREPERASWLERVVLARQLLGALGDEARAGGPPTDGEVAAISEARFWELARPRMVQVAHAVVLSEQENADARALAERVASATASVKDAPGFVAAAKAIKGNGLRIKVESLPPVAPDGRAVDPEAPPPAGPAVQHFDRDFTAAAHRLRRPGEQSPVVRSAFGYHVLYLVKVIEPRQPSLDERRALLHDEIMSQRATALVTALFEQQRRELQPSQSRSAIASMRQLPGASRGAER